MQRRSERFLFLSRSLEIRFKKWSIADSTHIYISMAGNRMQRALVSYHGWEHLRTVRRNYHGHCLFLHMAIDTMNLELKRKQS